MTNDGAQRATMSDVVAGHASARPGATATVCGEHRADWSALEARVAGAAGLLDDLGVGDGDRVAWLAQNCHRYLEVLLACGRVGAVFCPLNWRQQAEEVRFVLDDVDPVVVLWQEQELGSLVAEVRRIGAAASATWIGHDDDGIEGYEARLSRGQSGPISPGSPDEPALLLYTAAFDGRPNGALLTQTSLLTQGMYGMLYSGFGPDAVYLNAGPLFHVGTLKATMATLLAGGTNVFVRRVDPVELCRIIAEERCTGAFLQPPTTAAVADVNRDGTYDLSSLRTTNRHGSGFGQTELGGVVTFVDRDEPCIGSAGRPGPFARVEIVDLDGRPVPPGETGEIVVRGPMVTAGYHRRPALTAERRRGGWHHTTDLGRREVDGSISFVGPLTRIIKSAAENIYPVEVERCLRTHPSVEDVAVIGVPDATWGQRVVAVVVPGGTPPDPDALVEHCRQHIASYKKPRAVIYVDALPRVGAAVDYDALDATHGGGGYPGSG